MGHVIKRVIVRAALCLLQSRYSYSTLKESFTATNLCLIQCVGLYTYGKSVI